MPLTDRTIKTLKPLDKDKFYADGRKLYLRVHPTGTKTFHYRQQSQRGTRWIRLGEYPSLGLADARVIAANMTTGTIPLKRTIQACYDEWATHINKTYKSPLQVRQRMEKHFTPEFGARNIAQVTRAEISSWLTAVAVTAPVQANRLLTDTKLLMSFAVERGWLESSPAELITQRTVGGREKTRDRYLTDAELVRFLQILQTDRFAPATRYALALLLITGQRSNEVRGLHSGELTGGAWRIPPQRAKNNIANIVSLPFLGKVVLASAIVELGSTPFDGMEGQVLARATNRMAFDPPFTPHDLRRTMATHMADLGVAPHVIEKCLNHTLGGVMAIYNRSDYAAEKAAAWRLWARHLLKLARKKAPAGEAGA